jgi:hypothetical protein
MLKCVSFGKNRRNAFPLHEMQISKVTYDNFSDGEAQGLVCGCIYIYTICIFYMMFSFVPLRLDFSDMFEYVDTVENE